MCFKCHIKNRVLSFQVVYDHRSNCRFYLDWGKRLGVQEVSLDNNSQCFEVPQWRKKGEDSLFDSSKTYIPFFPQKIFGDDVDVVLLVGGDVIDTFAMKNADGNPVWNINDLVELIELGIVVQPREGSNPETTISSIKELADLKSKILVIEVSHRIESLGNAFLVSGSSYLKHSELNSSPCSHRQGSVHQVYNSWRCHQVHRPPQSLQVIS